MRYFLIYFLLLIQTISKAQSYEKIHFDGDPGRYAQ